MEQPSERGGAHRDALVGIAEVMAAYEVTGLPCPTRPVPAWVRAPAHLEVVPAGALVGGFVSRIPCRDNDVARLYSPISPPEPAPVRPAAPGRFRRRVVLDSAVASAAAMAAAVVTRLG